MSALDEHLKRHRKRIIAREEKTFRELLAAYAEIENELKQTFDDLQKQIEAAQSAGEEISPSWFFREKRLKNLLFEVSKQIVRFGGKARRIIERDQQTAIEIAIEQAQETYKFLIADAPDVENFAGSLNTRAVETAAGLMGDGSPLASYFEQQLAPMVAERIKSEVIKASAIGTNYNTIAKRLTETGGITKHRALSVARTEVNRVRRETTRQIFQENDDLIKGWEWVASKSQRTCPLCLAMDGKQFPLDEPFPQHINCRCTMIAVIIGRPRRARTIGSEWFEKQDDAIKETILGKEGFLAYRQNGLTLDDFVAFRNDKRFGKSVTRKPLAKILADKKTSTPPINEIFLPKNIGVDFDYGTRERLKDLLGAELSNNEIGALVGALDGADVRVSFSEEDEDNLFFEIDHPFVAIQQRTLGVDYADRLYFHNDYFRTAKDAPKGVGLQSFVTQAVNAKKFGVQYIHTLAAGDKNNPRFNGYYTWARIGYNSPLSEQLKQQLPIKYQKCRDLNELMLAGGKDVWKEIGSQREMIFDLSDDAASWKVLENYLRERGFVVRF